MDIPQTTLETKRLLLRPFDIRMPVPYKNLQVILMSQKRLQTSRTRMKMEWQRHGLKHIKNDGQKKI